MIIHCLLAASMIFQIVVDVLSRLIVYTDAGSRRAIGAVSLPDHGHRILLNVNDTPQAIALDIHIGYSIAVVGRRERNGMRGRKE